MRRLLYLLVLVPVAVSAQSEALLASQAGPAAADTTRPAAAADPSPASAETPAVDTAEELRLTLSGQLRHRTEADYRADGAPGDFHLLRTRLNAQFAPTDDVVAFVQIQDARTFGGENPAAGRGTLDGSAPLLDVHQAYFAVADLFDTPLAVKVGRQELAYGNERLIGSLGWSNVGRTFDAGVARYATDRLAVDVFGARLVDGLAARSEQNLAGVYGTVGLGAGASLDVFGLYDDDTAEIAAGPAVGASALVRGTTGARLFGKTGAVDYDLEGAYQFGRQSRGETLGRAPISAYLASAEAGVSVGKGRVGALYTVLSGDDPASDTDGAFNTLFATNHKFYGFADLFPFTAAVRPGGLHDAALRASYAVAPRTALRLDLHHFRLDRDLGAGTALGQEVDLTATYRYNDALGLVGGVSVFFAADQIEAVRGKDVLSWLYLSSVVDF